MIEIIRETLIGFLEIFMDMAPYLLFGFFAAGLISAFISPKSIERHLGGGGVWNSVKAALVGVPLPLCSCGVIPVAASLRRHGAGRGATTSFLLSTPQTGVDSILVTLSLLGPVWAIYRPVAALLSGIIGGSLVSLLVREKDSPVAVQADHSGHSHELDEECDDECDKMPSDEAKTIGGKLRGALSYGFITLPADIGRALLVGLFIAALISALAPDDFFAAYIGTGVSAMLIMMIAGIPVYVCATASVPIAAVLIMKGVPAGAVWAFLVAGPATNAATIATVWKVMGARATVIYLGAVALTAIGGGLLLDSVVIPAAGEHAIRAVHGVIPEPIKYLSGAALLGVLIYAIVMERRKAGAAAAFSAEGGVSLRITGMTCGHCAESVKSALQDAPGVDFAEVDLKAGRAVVRGDNPDMPALTEAVKEAGYQVDRED